LSLLELGLFAAKTWEFFDLINHRFWLLGAQKKCSTKIGSCPHLLYAQESILQVFSRKYQVSVKLLCKCLQGTMAKTEIIYPKNVGA
jgi:hypothetical protein